MAIFCDSRHFIIFALVSTITCLNGLKRPNMDERRYIMVSKVNVDLKKEYFSYLIDVICDKEHMSIDYIPLLDLLHSIKFKVLMERDENRVADGEHLRREFLDDRDIDKEYLYELEDMDVSVLEVLIGIAKRMESQLGNVTQKDRTSERFWELLGNLGVEKYKSDNYKPANIRDKIEIWMLRKYKKDGSGGIFLFENQKMIKDASRFGIK